MSVTHIDLPTSPAFRSVAFKPVGRTQRFVSDLTGAERVTALTGRVWEASYELPPLTPAQAREWRAFFAALSGGLNLFYGYDPSAGALAGLSTLTSDPAATRADSDIITADSSLVAADEWAGDASSPGAPTVFGGGQTGTILKTTGWVPGFRIEAGEYVAFDYTDPDGNSLRALHILTTGRTAGDDGRANLVVAPPVRIAPAHGATVLTDPASCSMRVTTDDGVGWQAAADGFTRPIAFTARQVLVAEATG